MDKLIHAQLINVIKAEIKHILQTEKDPKVEEEKVTIWFNIKNFIDNYDELEPILREYFDKKNQKDKCER